MTTCSVLGGLRFTVRAARRDLLIFWKISCPTNSTKNCKLLGSLFCCFSLGQFVLCSNSRASPLEVFLCFFFNYDSSRLKCDSNTAGSRKMQMIPIDSQMCVIHYFNSQHCGEGDNKAQTLQYHNLQQSSLVNTALVSPTLLLYVSCWL